MSRWPFLYLRYLAVPAKPVPLLLIVIFGFGLAFASFGGRSSTPTIPTFSSTTS